MTFKLITLVMLLFYAVFLNGQTLTGKVFQHFATVQDSLFHTAYEQRDIEAYDSLLNGFIAYYNKLDSINKKQFTPYIIDAYYNFSCIYALLNNKRLAVRYLDSAIKKGYYDYEHIQQDSDLNNTRNDATFKVLIQPLREVGDYRYILKKGSQYNMADSRSLPSFTYQSADDSNLILLRKSFHLDSIAGTGNEVSRMLNLMHWIYNLIPHDGNHNNPAVRNAKSLITVCKQQHSGLNCRGLATVLNECYLSLGFISRMVTCLPKDSRGVDADCHVINAVYSTSLHKWLWIDPTFDAYVMNEKGELLSIEEVRERIINDEPLILNPDANWNHKISQTKEEYLYHYMAKNLYRLECAASSEYNLETREKGKALTYIQLVPLDCFKQVPDKTESTDRATGTTWIEYKTNNAKLFRQQP